MAARQKPFTARFWGVRGSCATPGPSTVRVGGNTSCVEVRAGDDIILMDFGTGARPLGLELAAQGPQHITSFITHVHWDHIQGFPFFAPCYLPGNRIDMYVEPVGDCHGRDAFQNQMSKPNFPVSIGQETRAELHFHDIVVDETLKVGAAQVTSGRLRHPDAALGYRVQLGRRSLVYATDTEHATRGVDRNLVRLAEDADILIYDAQYTPEEYPNKVGWGHSTWQAGVTLAAAAGVKTLFLFHHDPTHDDAFMDDLEKRARMSFPQLHVAREGTIIDV